MPRDNNGNYTLPPVINPVVSNTNITVAWANPTLSDIATAITGSSARDGSAPPTANQPMSTFKHTNVGAGAALTDYLRVDQAQNSSFQFLTSVAGTVNAITASAPVAPLAYVAGQTFRFVSTGANSGAVTLNVNGLGAKAITKYGTVPLSTGDISASAVVEVIYDGTQFQLGNTAATTYVPTVQSFNGTGAQTAFVLSTDPGSAAALVVRISGAVQTPGVDYTVVGTGLTFTEAPPAGTGNVVVQNFGVAVGVGSIATSGVVYPDTSTLNQYIGPVGAGAVIQLAAGDPLFRLPTVAGTNGQLLSTNGSGVLSWITPAANAISAGDSNATVNDSGTGSTFTVSLDTVETLRLNERILGIGVNPTGWGGGSRGFETSGGMLYSTGSTRLIQAGNVYDAAGNTDYRFRSGGLYAIIDEYSNSLGLRTFYTSTATGSAGGVPTLVEVMKMGTGAYPYVEVKALSLAYPGSYSDISASTLNWDSNSQGATVLRFKDTNCTVTLPTSAGSSKGRILFLSNITAHSVTSASANVVPLGSNTAGTAILPAVAGKFAVLFYDNNRWLTILAN